jgi:ParB family chromosome partitioning protein
MAKRMRLTPPRPDFFAADPAPVASGSASRPPIAQVAAEAATAAALADVAGELRAARAEGRLVQSLAIEAIEVDHLVRDRMAVDDAEMATLRESLRARGQQTPIEVVDLGDGRYGLISGWRRISALETLRRETGEDRFGKVLALLRRPDSAAEAYLAMVEENEVRVGLSYYERARIVARAAEQGVYTTPQIALRGLFSAASRSKRSKIASFLVLHDALDGVLRFPTAIGERLGLALAKALSEDAAFGPRLVAALRASAPDSASAEAAVLQKALAGGGRPPALTSVPPGEEIVPGVFLETGGGTLQPRYTLSGPKVDAGFRAALIAWARDRSGGHD